MTVTRSIAGDFAVATREPSVGTTTPPVLLTTVVAKRRGGSAVIIGKQCARDSR